MHETSERPHDALEAWTWTFHYIARLNGTRALDSIDLKDGVGSTVTLRQAKLSLNDFIRKLTGICATLPALPETKSIILHIGYTADRPLEYFAPGFEQPAIDIAKFPASSDWRKTTTEVGIMSAGHHAASLTVSYLQKLNANIPDVVPSGLDYSHRTGLLDDVMKNLDQRAKALKNTSVQRKCSKMASLSSLSMEEEDQDPPLGPAPTTPSASELLQPSDTDMMEQQQIRDMVLVTDALLII